MEKNIALGESNVQAFFQDTNNPEEIAKTLSAFANSEGGKLILGLKKNGKITGINPVDELKNIERIIKAYTTPDLLFLAETRDLGFRKILIISIEKSEFIKYEVIGKENIKEMQ